MDPSSVAPVPSVALILGVLVLVTGALQRHGALVWVVFLGLPLALTGPLLAYADLSWFGWAKLYTLAVGCCLVQLARGRGAAGSVPGGAAGEAPHPSRRVRWLILAVLAVNILEAAIREAQRGYPVNALAGVVLVLLLPGPSSLTVVDDGGRPGLAVRLGLPWILAYTAWNWAFTCAVFPTRLADQVALLVAPLLLARGDLDRWLELRAFSLGAYMLVLIGVKDLLHLPWFADAPAEVGSSYPVFVGVSVASVGWALVARLRGRTAAGRGGGS